MRSVEEVITEERLRDLLRSKEHPIAYIGYEPSGKLHLGHKIGIDKMRDLLAAGFEAFVLLADIHAFLNEKGELGEIRKTAMENKRVFEALGLEGARFILGGSTELDFSDKDGFQMSPDYQILWRSLAAHISEQRAIRSVRELARDPKKMKASHIIYPVMQVADIVKLDVDLAVGGMDQRHIHMLGEDVLHKLGYKTPVFLHLPIISDIRGEKKMASSFPQALIALDDPPEKIEEKIKKAICPPTQVKGNPVLEIAEHHVFRWDNEITIGSSVITSYKQLRELYAKGKIHPLDLKEAVAGEHARILEPVRKRFARSKLM